MRLDKYLSDILNITRTEAKKAISAGRVTIDEKVIKTGSAHVGEEEVLFDGEPLRYQQFYYIMLHKPKGCVCANRDNKSKTVFDLLPAEYRRKDLFVCGRLDKDTTGLVLLTNNGPLAHRLLAPKKEIYKEYLVTLRDKVTKEDITKLQTGVILKDGVIFKPARYIQIGDRYGSLQISEGKFHQVKRMFAALGNEVVELHRRSIHGLILDDRLPEGECRYLTEDEIKFLEAVE